MKMLLVFHSGAIDEKIQALEKQAYMFMEASQNEDISGIASQENS